jgi:hypothetical protein
MLDQVIEMLKVLGDKNGPEYLTKIKGHIPAPPDDLLETLHSEVQDTLAEIEKIGMESAEAKNP